MVKEINKDTESLKQKSQSFIFGEDDYLITDMLDTANAHKENCVGLACIQIGVPKRVILVRQGLSFTPFINPVIIKKSTSTYLAEEGCLSLDGTRQVKRHRTVKVMWQDTKGKQKVREFNGFTAQIIQHEVDHCNGLLI